MKVNKIKLARQEHGIKLWGKAGGIGCLWWFTGVGKTYTACLILNKMFKKRPEAKAIVIVPGDELYKQWTAELDAHISKEHREQIEVYTVQYVQLHKLHLKCTLAIYDELHEYYSEDRMKVIDGTWIDYEFNLGLTATYEHLGGHKKMEKYCPIVDHIDEKEAVEKGYISKFLEFNLSIDMNEDEKAQYDIFTTKIGQFMQKFGKNNPLGVAQMCLGGTGTMSGWQYANVLAQRNGWYKGCDPEIESLWHPRMIMGYAKNLMAFIRERSDLINNSDTKLQAVLSVAKKYDDLKTICFSESTAFADKLALTINDDFNTVESNELGYYEICEVYHSALNSRFLPSPKTGKLIKFGSKRLKERAINRIKAGEARIISTAKALDRGFDVKDIRMGITSSGTRNPTQHSQRGGRVKRIESYSEDIIVLIINIYFEGTVDEDKLRQRQRKSTNVVYWVDSLDQINYRPKKNKVFNI